MPAVSVIVPTYNRHDLLPSALLSLTHQSFNDFEILLVDDNPIENRLADNNQLAPLLEDSRIQLIEHHCSLCCANAKNEGIRHACGNWITYLDDDNTYHPDKIRLQYELAESKRSPLVICGIYYDLGLRKRIKQVSLAMYCEDDILLKAIPDTNTLFHRNDGETFYDEEMRILDDAELFYDFVRRYSITAVPNVTQALVKYYIMPIERVSKCSASDFWMANRKLYINLVRKYRRTSARIYLARILVSKYKFSTHEWRLFIKNSVRLLKLGGIKEWRLIVNVFFAKFRWTRRFVIT